MLGILPGIEGGRGFWFVVGILTLGVLVVAGGHFFSGAWKVFRHHDANMDTLVALGTGSAWLYSMAVLLWPEKGSSLARHAYFEAAVIHLAGAIANTIVPPLSPDDDRPIGLEVWSLLGIDPGRLDELVLDFERLFPRILDLLKAA